MSDRRSEIPSPVDSDTVEQIRAELDTRDLSDTENAARLNALRHQPTVEQRASIQELFSAELRPVAPGAGKPIVPSETTDGTRVFILEDVDGQVYLARGNQRWSWGSGVAIDAHEDARRWARGHWQPAESNGYYRVDAAELKEKTVRTLTVNATTAPLTPQEAYDIETRTFRRKNTLVIDADLATGLSAATLCDHETKPVLLPANDEKFAMMTNPDADIADAAIGPSTDGPSL